MELWAQYGLVGLMVGGLYAGIAWAGVRILGKDGIMDRHSEALGKVATCVEQHSKESIKHMEACVSANEKIDVLHRAAIASLAEIEDECSGRGMDVRARVNRVRAVLGETQ